MCLIVHAAMVGQQLPCALSGYVIPHDAFSRPGPQRAFCLHVTPFPAVACFPAPVGLRLAVLGTCGGFLGTWLSGYFSAGVPGVFAFPVRRG